MDLQNAFYIVAIIYMGVMMVIAIAVLALLLTLRSKLLKLQQAIDERLNVVRKFSRQMNAVFSSLRIFAKH